MSVLTDARLMFGAVNANSWVFPSLSVSLSHLLILFFNICLVPLEFQTAQTVLWLPVWLLAKSSEKFSGCWIQTDGSLSLSAELSMILNGCLFRESRGCCLKIFRLLSTDWFFTWWTHLKSFCFNPASSFLSFPDCSLCTFNGTGGVRPLNLIYA